MKLLIDECIGKGIFLQVAEALRRREHPVECVHLLDFNGQQGVPDELWVPRAAKQGFSVVTGDSGRSKLGAPLHLVMPRHGVTGAYFSGKLCQRRGQEKAEAVLAVFEEFRARAARHPPGMRFKISATLSGYRLTDWPLTSGPLPPRPAARS